jgi:hypothetical protein
MNRSFSIDMYFSLVVMYSSVVLIIHCVSALVLSLLISCLKLSNSFVIFSYFLVNQLMMSFETSLILLSSEIQIFFLKSSIQ